MFLKARNKLLRKYDSDFWNFLYNRRRKNKFFAYFKLSLINKLIFYKRKKLLTISKIKRLKLNKVKNYNLFLTLFNFNFNFYKFFKRSKAFVKRIFFKVTQKKINKLDNLFGVKSSFKSYTNKVKSPFLRFKNFLKIFTLFYNNFNQKKLKKLSNSIKKSKLGGLNFFFIKLESRLDSILLRLNIGTKFFSRKLIRSSAVLVNNICINFLNYITKLNDIISFNYKYKKLIYYILLKTVKHKRFFAQPPFYLEINYRTLSFQVIPQLVDPLLIPYPFFFNKTNLLLVYIRFFGVGKF